MKFKSFSSFLVAFAVLFSVGCAKKNEGSRLDDFDPKSPDAEEQLEQLDKEYELETGKPSHIPRGNSGCYQTNCPVFILVDKETQMLNLYLDGQLTEEWKVSSGKAGYETIDYNGRPNGRIYDKYSSKKYPGGDYQGLGNMPYAFFFQGGYGIHGTPKVSWKKLGTKASHGCVRIHPENAKLLNRLIRENGVANTWITVQ